MLLTDKVKGAAPKVQQLMQLMQGYFTQCRAHRQNAFCWSWWRAKAKARMCALSV
jgi:hypothetical protein